jgi:hypothetical protein
MNYYRLAIMDVKRNNIKQCHADFFHMQYYLERVPVIIRTGHCYLRLRHYLSQRCQQKMS